MIQQTLELKDKYETPAMQDIQPVTVAVCVGGSGDNDNTETGDDLDA